jgi:RNA polymerase sigma-70 factor (ECF subfamily)
VTQPAPVLSRVATGDPAAVRECLDRFGPLVWSLARRHSQSRSDAEDAVQDIFVDLLGSAKRFDGSRGTESGFVAMIARRRLIDLARRRAVRKIESATEGQRGSDPGSTPIDPRALARSLEAEDQLDAKAVVRVIEGLPDAERDVLLLSTLGGRSYSEIATEKGLPLGTVKTYARRGLLRARAALGEVDDPRGADPRRGSVSTRRPEGPEEVQS